MKGKAVA